MSKKDKRREELRLGKKDMSFAEIMQAIGACRADDCDKCLLNGGPIAGWFPEDVPDCLETRRSSCAAPGIGGAGMISSTSTAARPAAGRRSRTSKSGKRAA